MKKINVLGINVKCHNEREESLINIIKRAVKNFYRTYNNKPNSIDSAYDELYGNIQALYYMDVITFENFITITDRLHEVYRFTEYKARNLN